LPRETEVWLPEEVDECMEPYEPEDSSRRWSDESEANAQETLQLFDSTAVALKARLQVVVPLEIVQKEIALINNRMALLEQSAPLWVPIQSLAPEPYEVVKPFQAVVRTVDGEYIASFFDANLSASGETHAEAVLNLKDIIAGTFDILTGMKDSDLGPGPLQQKRTLEEFIRRKQ
jgi:predicted RNase H-like HicB family nuclease